MMKQVKHLPHEADIGSGEKSPGEKETEKIIEQIGKFDQQPNPPQKDKQPDTSKTK